MSHPARTPRRRVRARRPGLERLEDRQLLATVVPGYFITTEISSVPSLPVARGITDATAMDIAPDGRIWTLGQGGEVRVFTQGSPDGAVALTIPAASIDARGERGLLGIAFDPAYNAADAAPDYVYMYYTSTDGGAHNRVSRFTADNSNPNAPTLGSEQVIVDLDPLSSATNHNGGAIHFGPDGKLYVAVGDNNTSANSQGVANRLGKILRINADGTIPADNPTSFPGVAGTPTGANRAIWAVGLRNPYSFAFQPGTGRLHVNDVGQNSFEEVNPGIAGANYGWPATEGDFDPAAFPDYTRPLHAYAHGTGSDQGFAIAGGAFFAPLAGTLIGTPPTSYDGDYAFADFINGWIRAYDAATGQVFEFASGLDNPVDLHAGPDGILYALERGTGTIVTFVPNQVFTIPDPPINPLPPLFTPLPETTTLAVGRSTNLGFGTPPGGPFTFQWERAEPGSDTFVAIPGATGALLGVGPARASDDGARYRVLATGNGFLTTSNPTRLVVTPARVASDFDGDGRSDVAVYLPNAGAFAYRPSTSTTGQGVLAPFGYAGAGQTLPAVADYDGDGKADVAAFLTPTATYAYRPSGGGPDVLTSFGAAGVGQSIPTPGDFFGTGHAEVAIYLPNFGAFAIRPRSGGGDVLVPFGYAGAGETLPAVADYDGDGKDDIAAYLPRLGVLAIRPSAGGPDRFAPIGQAGVGRTVPVPGDYDGDGLADAAVYLPGLALFAYRPSRGGADVLTPFGSANDGSIPLAGSFSGSGLAEVALFHPPTASFAYRPSGTTGSADVITRFGSPGVLGSLPTTEPPGSVATGRPAIPPANPLPPTTAAATPPARVTRRASLPRRPAVAVANPLDPLARS